MSAGRSLACALVAATVATGCSDSAIETGALPIIGGVDHAGDPAVIEFVALVSPTAAVVCSAIVLSPKVVLTAAHCIFETAPAPNGIFLGPRNPIVNPRLLLPIATIVLDPKLNQARTDLGHDLAVLVMAAPLPIAPLRLNRAPLPATLVGKEVRFVGYGANEGRSKAGAGIKRQAMLPVTALDELIIRTGPAPRSTCRGDSGGPMFFDLGQGEVVIGISSFSDDENCMRRSFFQRLDTQVGWLDEMIEKHDPVAGRPPDAGVADASSTDMNSPANTGGSAAGAGGSSGGGAAMTGGGGSSGGANGAATGGTMDPARSGGAAGPGTAGAPATPINEPANEPSRAGCSHAGNGRVPPSAFSLVLLAASALVARGRRSNSFRQRQARTF